MQKHEVFRGVPELGQVVLTNHAIERLIEEKISDFSFENVIYHGRDAPEGGDTVWRELNNIRAIIILGHPNVVKTVYRIYSSR